MYKRQVVYLDTYENGEVLGNCGYAKIQISDEECRIEINADNAFGKGKNVKAYLFWEGENGYEVKEVFSGKMDSGEIHLKDICRCEDIWGNDRADERIDKQIEHKIEDKIEDKIEHIKGIFMFDGGNFMRAICGTLERDDVSFGEVSKKIKQAGEKKDNHIGEGEEGESSRTAEGEEGERNLTAEGEEGERNLTAEGEEGERNLTVEGEEEKSSDTAGEEKKEEISTQSLTFPQEKVEKIDISDNSVYEYDEECLKNKCSEKDEGTENHLSTNSASQRNMGKNIAVTWQEKLFRVFPKVILKINGQNTCGIKLKPHDMVWFPGCYWRLGSNKFLLNGYYHYRYILFFKGTGNYEGKFFLGTPGCFGVNDAITARKYGFTDFFAAGDCPKEEQTFEEEEQINFGFWGREL